MSKKNKKSTRPNYVKTSHKLDLVLIRKNVNLLMGIKNLMDKKSNRENFTEQKNVIPFGMTELVHMDNVVNFAILKCNQRLPSF